MADKSGTERKGMGKNRNLIYGVNHPGICHFKEEKRLERNRRQRRLEPLHNKREGPSFLKRAAGEDS